MVAVPAPGVLFVASEIYPMAKTGGLADVSAALPPALRREGFDIRPLMPGYESALDLVLNPQTVAKLDDHLTGGLSARLVAGRAPDSDMPIWLVDCPALFRRKGTLYQDSDGVDWPDNALRFGALSRVAAALALGRAVPDWRADIVHAHDWHAGLVPLMLWLAAGAARPATVFTIHNLAFQGNFPLDTAAALGLPDVLLTPNGIEFYGAMSFLKAGIVYADRVTTVSPTYAREICTPEYGFGMDGVLRSRARDLAGIMNGIDTELWDPATDPHLAARYSDSDFTGKAACKAELQQALGLAQDAAAPLAIFVSRLTSQKMADTLADTLPTMFQRHPRLQFALLGRGDRHLEEGFAALAPAFGGRLAVSIDYSEPLAHRLHGAGDILMHGSRFEPCGLTQLYAMRYGTLPIVRRIGGLADSVVDPDAANDNRPATGFAFDAATGEAMMGAVDRSVAVLETRPELWRTLQRQAMAADFSWTRSAKAYRALYYSVAPHLVPARKDALPGRAAGETVPSLAAE